MLGHDVTSEPGVVRTLIGLAGQFAAVDENLTGAENLSMVGRLNHMSKTQLKERSLFAARAIRPHRRGKPADQDVLRRDAQASRRRRLARRPPESALPRRADNRPGSGEPSRMYGR